MAAVGGESAVADVEAAGRMLDKHMNYDSCFPTLTDKLQFSPKGNA